MHEIKKVSERTLRRLPQYLHLLNKLKEQGRERVSTTHLATDLRFDPTQVRKDLAVTGIIGKPKTGYGINELIGSVREFLGWNNSRDAILVGAGNLGTALLGYEAFKNYGLNIVSVFDNDPQKIGRVIYGREIMPVEKMVNLMQGMNIHIGIITVSASAAQNIAGQMLAGGVQAIWNFAPVALDIPEHIIIENAQLSVSFAVLSSKITRYFKNK